MGFRISARDLHTDAAVAPYETRAATEELAHAEATRLGVRIVALTPLEAPVAEAAAGPTPAWSSAPLHWRTGRWTLVRLGFEHPRWGAWLYYPLLTSVLLIRTKVLFKLFVAATVATLAAVGIDAHPALVTVLAFPALVGGPLLLVKLYVFAQLRREHARDGFDTAHRLRFEPGALHHDDGGRTRTIDPARITSVHEMPHFVLLGLRDGGEIAVPRSALHSAALARRFATMVATAAGIEAKLGFRSAWVGERRVATPWARFMLHVLLFALCATLLIMVLMLLLR